MTTEPSALDVAHEWARQTLGRDQATDVPSLLRRISNNDYAMPGDQIDAVQIAVGSGRPADRAEIIYRTTQAMRRQRLENEITQFQQQFFELSGYERDITWQTLIGEATEDPDLTVRLTRLLSGINVECPSEPEDLNQKRLWKVCREIFLASPPVATSLRAATIAEWTADPATWDEAARTLVRVNRAFYRAVAPWLIQFQKETCAEAFDAGRLLLLNPRKFFAIFYSLAAVLAIGWILFADSIIAKIVFPSLLATLVGWAKGYRPWCWLLSLPHGLIVMLFLPVCSRLPPRRRRQQRNRGDKVGAFISGFNLVIGLFVMTSFIDFAPPRRGDTPRQLRNLGQASPVATPPLDRESPQYKAAYEATRILMGIPENPTPEQKAMIERGFSAPEFPRPGQQDRSR